MTNSPSKCFSFQLEAIVRHIKKASLLCVLEDVQEVVQKLSRSCPEVVRIRVAYITVWDKFWQTSRKLMANLPPGPGPAVMMMMMMVMMMIMNL